ncbi:tetratricopeptide repeat protein [Lacibacter cauensis]|uniref:Tetratricopeptide repeat protein n=1 Tax=Lacibacter cauensis TaxID=510947 RepID=A0A562SIV5_9BACT|nr:tetratricopeptide repeat protein [Lacibacter cauensis]TWI81172.1 tetratricopeptide repeat protein [Lacibacter cauensis]
MKRSLSLAFVAIVFVQQLFAQSIEDGKKFMYYERFKSAKEVFEKLVAANPKNEEAAYWLGQAYIGLEDVAKAKETYQAALQASATSPLLMAGMGHVELLENKTTDARNHFDMAVNNSKSKDNEVLHAVGRANAYTKAGDANYGITHLQKITTTKKFNDPSVYVTIGDAYRKLVDGGNAVLAFKNALNLNPKYAAAKHKEGLIYESQKNKDYFLPAYEEAVAMDPAYGPALYSLYVYWYFRDVAKAEDYLHKYIAAIDSDPQNDYYTIDLKYAAGKYSEAITLADALITKVGVNVIKPRIYRLKAYSYFKGGDMANAKASIDEFFKKSKPEEIVPKDYELLGDILAATKGSEAQSYAYYEKAMDADTVQDNKASYLDKAVALAKKQGDKPATAYWLDKQYKAKKSPSNVDMYNLGRAFFDAGSGGDFSFYTKSDSVFAVYTEKYPDQAYGYYWRARANWSIDTSMVNGMANPHFEKFVQVASASKDSVSFRPQIKLAYKYFIGYNIFVKKDYKVAIEFCDKILAIDPTDKEATEYKRQLTGGKSQTTGSTTTTKPGGVTSNSAGSSSSKS